MRIQPTTLIQNWINSKKELKNDHIRIKTMKYFFSPDHDNMHTYSLQKTPTTIDLIYYPTPYDYYFYAKSYQHRESFDKQKTKFL